MDCAFLNKVLVKSKKKNQFQRTTCVSRFFTLSKFICLAVCLCMSHCGDTRSFLGTGPHNVNPYILIGILHLRLSEGEVCEVEFPLK